MAGGRPKKEAGKKYVKQNITMDPEQLERLVDLLPEGRPAHVLGDPESLGNVSGKCSLVVGIGGYQYLLKLK